MCRRSFVRAGISQPVAQKLSGHASASVNARYVIVWEGDLKEARATKLAMPFCHLKSGKKKGKKK
jgi:hypothetical protein